MPDPVDYSRHDIEDDGYVTVTPPPAQATAPGARCPFIVVGEIRTVVSGTRVLHCLTGDEGTMCAVLEPAEARTLARYLFEQADAAERSTSQGEPA